MNNEITKSGLSFIQHINSLYDTLYISERTNRYVLDAWATWEEQGQKKPVDLVDTINNPNKLLELYYRDILSVFKHTGNRKFIKPFFVFASIRNMNAHAVRADNNDLVIIMDLHLERFFIDFAITTMVCAYSKPNNLEIDYYYNHIIRSFGIFSDDPDKLSREADESFLKILQKDYDLAEWGAYISRAMIFFILCHEISHHILGHTSKSENMPVYINSGNSQSIKYDQKSIIQEFEADEMGYEYYFKLIDNFGKLEWARVNDQLDRVPLLFFEILDFYHCFREIKENRKILHITHPSPKLRKDKLHKKYNSKMTENGVGIYEGLMEVIEKFSYRFKQEFGKEAE